MLSFVCVLWLIVVPLAGAISTLMDKAIEISFDWSVRCPDSVNSYAASTDSGIYLAEVFFYNRPVYNRRMTKVLNVFRKLAGSEGLYHNGNFSCSHYRLELPIHPECQSLTQCNFGFRWLNEEQSELQERHNEATSCCWSVSNVTITSRENNDSSQYQSNLTSHYNIDTCYKQSEKRTYQYNGTLWVCPYGNNGKNGRRRQRQFESATIMYNSSSSILSGFSTKSQCSNKSKNYLLSTLPSPSPLTSSSSCLIYPLSSMQIANESLSSSFSLFLTPSTSVLLTPSLSVPLSPSSSVPFSSPFSIFSFPSSTVLLSFPFTVFPSPFSAPLSPSSSVPFSSPVFPLSTVPLSFPFLSPSFSAPLSPSSSVFLSSPFSDLIPSSSIPSSFSFTVFPSPSFSAPLSPSSSVPFSSPVFLSSTVALSFPFPSPSFSASLSPSSSVSLSSSIFPSSSVPLSFPFPSPSFSAPLSPSSSVPFFSPIFPSSSVPLSFSFPSLSFVAPLSPSYSVIVLSFPFSDLFSSSSISSSFSFTVFPSPSFSPALSPLSSVPFSSPFSAQNLSSSVFPSLSLGASLSSDALSSLPLSVSSSVTPLQSSAISVMIPLSTPLPDPMCVADGVWPQTKPDTNVTLSREVKECFNGTVEASRLCGSNGEWSNVTCILSSIFKMSLNEIMESPIDGLDTLQEILPEVPLVQSVFLFSTALDTVLETSDNGNISRQLFTEIFLNITDDLISASANDENDDTRSVGSQLLKILDRFALEFATANEQTETEEFILNVLEFNESVAVNSSITSIKDNQGNSITLPQEIFTPGNKIRVGSFLFRNLSHLLPPVDTNSSIISPIISSTIDCQSCPVTNLTQNVTIQLRIERPPSSNEILKCVFFNFKIRDGLLPTGDWSTSGCTTVTVDGDLITCSCNHLTHFAILLSPGGPEISPIHYKVLTTIGLVLVPISLLCMAMVILTYSLIRSLWSLRNYVHIMLCVSLFMAQLVFIIGVDKIENQGVCSAVAVILVYLFLVTFMWMLMEGVVLYVTLVRVFITNHKYYAISFTVASYVIPAVYMAVIIPIGYLINVDDIPDHTHFLYYYETDDDNVPSLTACWVNYSTGFVWSFIAPVIVIILLNVGFFIMAIVIMRKHIKRQKDKANSAKLRHWILVTISLTVVMGIAWLVGVMAFRRELLPVAYITAIFIAAQGIILFIILVLLSKQVREAYIKLWINQRSQSVMLTRLTDFMKSPFIFSGYSSVSVAKEKAYNHHTSSNGGGKHDFSGISDKPANVYNEAMPLQSLANVADIRNQTTSADHGNPIYETITDKPLNPNKPTTNGNCGHTTPHHYEAIDHDYIRQHVSHTGTNAGHCTVKEQHESLNPDDSPASIKNENLFFSNPGAIENDYEA